MCVLASRCIKRLCLRGVYDGTWRHTVDGSQTGIAVNPRRPGPAPGSSPGRASGPPGRGQGVTAQPTLPVTLGLPLPQYHHSHYVPLVILLPMLSQITCVTFCEELLMLDLDQLLYMCVMRVWPLILTCILNLSLTSLGVHNIFFFCFFFFH